MYVLYTFQDETPTKIILTPLVLFVLSQHFRNFEKELQGKNFGKGWEELSLFQTARDLLGQEEMASPSNHSIAMTTRFPNDPSTMTLVQEVRALGTDIRITQNHTALQDFCFLKHAQHELVGHYRSTFALWAALLGNARRVRFYAVEPASGKFKKGLVQGFFYNWTNPLLKDRIRYEVYKEQDH